MGDLALEVGGQVDDLNGVERALFGADTAADAETLTNECDLAVGVDFDTELAGLDDGAGLLALLTAFLGLALVGVDDRDTVYGMSFLSCVTLCGERQVAARTGRRTG